MVVIGTDLWTARVDVTFKMELVVIVSERSGEVIMSVLLEMDKEMFLYLPPLVFLFLL